jgi:DNA primase
LGVDENERQRAVVEALRIKDTVVIEEEVDEPEFTIEFPERDLPQDCVPLTQAPAELLEYAQLRQMPVEELLWSDTKPARMYKRIIIPCTWQGRVIGSTARAADNETKPKYFNNYESNYVYGIDRQIPGGKFSVVCEGIIDALTIGGVATLTNRCNDTQAQIIDTLGREIVLVPDRDKAGQKLIDDALEYGWSVSFPEWEADVKDINAAVIRYGRLFTLKSIIDAKQTNRLKINLMRKRFG